MLHKLPAREQVLANCVFLFAAEVDLITYHCSVPRAYSPYPRERQYHALVVQKGCSASRDIGEHVLLRTSEASSSCDAATAMLADEIERQIGELVSYGARRGAPPPASMRKTSLFAAESVWEPYLARVHVDCPAADEDHEIQLAAEVEEVLALGRAHSDAALIADLEAWEDRGDRRELLEGCMGCCGELQDEMIRSDEIQHAVDIADALACEREKFDDEVIAHLECYMDAMATASWDVLGEGYSAEGGCLVDYSSVVEQVIRTEAETGFAASWGADSARVQFEQDVLAGFDACEAALAGMGEEYIHASGYETESTIPDNLTPSSTDTLPPQYTSRATDTWASRPTFSGTAGTPQMDSEEALESEATLTSGEQSFENLYVPRRSRGVNAWLEGQYARRERTRQRHAAPSWADVSDSDTTDVSRELARPAGGRKTRTVERQVCRKRRTSRVLAQRRDKKPEYEDIHPAVRPRDDEIAEPRLRRKPDDLWSPSPPAPNRAYPHLADLATHIDGPEPTHRSSINAWINAAKAHWTHAQRHRATGRAAAAHVDFVLALTIVREIVPCFPAIRAGSAAFVEFVQLESELKRNVDEFVRVRDEIRRCGGLAGVPIAAEAGYGRGGDGGGGGGRGRGKGKGGAEGSGCPGCGCRAWRGGGGEGVWV